MKTDYLEQRFSAWGRDGEGIREGFFTAIANVFIDI